ncbi:MAG: NAD-dependent epimerase/dehydratase family protein [Planctomycetota bacterium]
MPERILITGGAGLIGLATTRQLAAAGHELVVLDLPEQVDRAGHLLPDGVAAIPGTILDAPLLRDAIAGCSAVVHLAARLGVRRTEADKLGCLRVNIDGTATVLDAAIDAGAKRIVFASSSEVYGEPLHNPITERDITQGKTVYAVTKLAGEELCHAFAQRHGIEAVVLRYFNCYGPNQVAQFVVPKWVWEVEHGRRPIVNGDGSQVRSYTFVDDTAAATAAAVTHPDAPGQTLNISNGTEPVSLLDLADRVIAAAGQTGTITPDVRADFAGTDRAKDREIDHRFCHGELAQQTLDWTPQVSLDEGLQRMVAAVRAGELWEDWAA